MPISCLPRGLEDTHWALLRQKPQAWGSSPSLGRPPRAWAQSTLPALCKATQSPPQIEQGTCNSHGDGVISA